MKEYLDKIGELIGKDELEEAILMLNKLLEKDKRLDELILQSARLNDIEKQIRLGIVDFKNASLTKNQIRFGILSIVREIEKDLNSEKSYFKNLKLGSLMNKNEVFLKVNQVHKGKGDNIAGDKIVK